MLIEQTAKRWKAWQLAGTLVLLGTPVLWLIHPGVCVAALIGGPMAYCYGRLGAWWNHG